jgi:hypothetical protein
VWENVVGKPLREEIFLRINKYQYQQVTQPLVQQSCSWGVCIAANPRLQL